MENKNKKNKNNPILPIIVFGAAVIGMFGENFSGDRGALVFVIAAVIIVVLVILGVYIAKAKLAQKSETENPFGHSHNRLVRTGTGADCTVDKHWQEQLDGFLKAGIIDRSEYLVLLKKHSEQAARSLR